LPALRSQNWTVWKLILQLVCRYPRSLKSPDHIDRMCELMACYLAHGADPSLVFVCYRCTITDDDTLQPVAADPFFFDLEQLIELVIGPAESKRTQDAAEKELSAKIAWHSPGLSDVFKGRTRGPYISPIETERLRDNPFYVVSVERKSDLNNVDFSIWDNWNSGQHIPLDQREHWEFEL
jgi:hypothetical protein